MRNVLNRLKNQFSDFHFSSYREDSLKIGLILGKKMTITRKINTFCVCSASCCKVLPTFILFNSK